MVDPFAIVKDSSVYTVPSHVALHENFNNVIRTGVVRSAYIDPTGELRYLVDVHHWTDVAPIMCRMLRRFGGVYNYEDYVYQGYQTNDKPDAVVTPAAKAGDVVLVAMIDGQGRNGVILGGLMHAARQNTLDADPGPQYLAEFNGVETSINIDGEYTILVKGLPTNIEHLNDVPNQAIAPPTYDTTVGSSFLKFDKMGGWKVSDNASSTQFIYIDKANGTLNVVSGNISLMLTKQSEDTALTTKTLTISAADQTVITTKTCSISASETAALKSPKVAIGKEGVELLDQLAQLVDKLGACMPMSPVGPCTPLMATPQWPQVEAVKSKIKEITGSF